MKFGEMRQNVTSKSVIMVLHDNGHRYPYFKGWGFRFGKEANFAIASYAPIDEPKVSVRVEGYMLEKLRRVDAILEMMERRRDEEVRRDGRVGLV